MEEGGGEKDANERTSDERFCFSSGLGVAKIERNSERECERRKRVIETSRWGGEERRGEERRGEERDGGGETDR